MKIDFESDKILQLYESDSEGDKKTLEKMSKL